jgi:hypothetical protein
MPKKKASKIINPLVPSAVESRIKASFAVMLDVFNEKQREHILLMYKSKPLLDAYVNIRNSGKYEKGGGKANHRKIVEFPDPTVFEFVNKVMKARFGTDWLYDNKALADELVKPWWVVKKIDRKLAR